ncbi:MAG: cytidine deaminase [Ruminococcus sp.]|uniref:Cytidine deaminase n=1 Tax=Ruminococcus albus TaxID=1264 RepID=A0A1H7IBI1_RUMAL|nr:MULTISPECIES: cytidine deaminase [Ruminococcus]MBO4867184.1 cytidine deaminase [Ruminococcus sp.]SEK59856.1 cytidine deaminase [Ruminococcus albus]
MENKELLELAIEAASNSYCSYSGFSVGAALLTEDGRIFTGCNVENSSFSLTICAERTAIFKAVSEGCRKFKAIAIVGGAEGNYSHPCCPCGACLQVMSEFCDDDFSIILTNGEFTLGEFLPMRFELN